MKNTPAYIKNLLLPTAKTQSERKVWSMGLETVIVPFLTATNTMGDTAIPHDALGAPLRLARDKDNSIRFNSGGKPVIRVAKPISDAVTSIRENFVATLKDYTQNVVESRPDDYALTVESSIQAAKPIKQQEQDDLDKAVKLKLEQDITDAETAGGSGDTETEPLKERELATV
jgi:hypothetical protein